MQKGQEETRGRKQKQGHATWCGDARMSAAIGGWAIGAAVESLVDEKCVSNKPLLLSYLGRRWAQWRAHKNGRRVASYSGVRHMPAAKGL